MSKKSFEGNTELDRGGEDDLRWLRRRLPPVAAMMALILLFGTIYVLRHAFESLPPEATAPTSIAAVSPELGMLVGLEQMSIRNRHRQASSILIAAIWMRIVGLVTGLLLCAAGAIFILTRLTEPAFNLGSSGPLTSGQMLSMSMSSSSPGLVSIAFGSMIILLTLFRDIDIGISHQPMYLAGVELQTNVSTSAPTAPKAGDGKTRGVALDRLAREGSSPSPAASPSPAVVR